MRRANEIKESTKKTLSQAVMTKNGETVWGDPRWGRTLANPEEHIRQVEGTVDENGNRRIFIEEVEGLVGKRARLLQYRNMGYKIEEDPDGFGHWAVISDKVYQEKVRAPQIDKALKRAKLTNPKGEVREGVSGSPMGAINSSALLADLPDDV